MCGYCLGLLGVFCFIEILWWGDVDHHGLGLFRHLEKGLAASLYLVDGP
jgi:hypothetical protein